MKIAILGVGLIGGSIGLAARRRTGAHVTGYDPDETMLSSAVELGAVDEPAHEIASAVREADVVFVATPVECSVEIACLALQAASAQCIVSDVGSTKRQISGAISDPRFIGGHPLAGAETAGVSNAREDLFDRATWYLTPPSGALAAQSPAAQSIAAQSIAAQSIAAQSIAAQSIAAQSTPAQSPPVRNPIAASLSAESPSVPARALAALRELIERLGARSVTIDPLVHDRLMASVSHLPHVLANVLVARALQACEPDGRTAHELSAGPSFRDATRVAGANTAIWTDIYISNGDLLVETIERAIDELQMVCAALQAGDAHKLAAWNERAGSERERLRQAGLVAGP